MAKIGRHIFGAAIAVLLVTGPLAAQERAPQGNLQDRTEKALKKGIETILRTLDGLIESVPQYEMPEVLDNGDIIIRRKRPEKEEKTKSLPDDTDRT